MGAHHGDFYSVPSFGLQPPLEQSAHSMVIQAFTLGEHPSNANYEKRKVILKEQKLQNWREGVSLQQSCRVGSGTEDTGEGLQSVVLD